MSRIFCCRKSQEADLEPSVEIRHKEGTEENAVSYKKRSSLKVTQEVSHYIAAEQLAVNNCNCFQFHNPGLQEIATIVPTKTPENTPSPSPDAKDPTGAGFHTCHISTCTIEIAEEDPVAASKGATVDVKKSDDQ